MKATIKDIINETAQFLSNIGTRRMKRLPGNMVFPAGQKPAYQLVIDASPSMDDNDYPPTRFLAAKESAIGFLRKCGQQTPDALVGVIFYSDVAHLACPLVPVRTHLQLLEEAIESGETAPCTNIGAGLTTAGDEFVSAGMSISPSAILLTDGHSNCGPDPVSTATQLKALGVRLDIIGIGGSPHDVNEAELRRMASVQDGQRRYWFIRDKFELVRKFAALALGKV